MNIFPLEKIILLLCVLHVRPQRKNSGNVSPLTMDGVSSHVSGFIPLLLPRAG